MTLKTQTNVPNFRFAGLSYIFGLLLFYMIDLVIHYLAITVGSYEMYVARLTSVIVGKYVVLAIFFSFLLFGIQYYSREYTEDSEPSMKILLISSIANISFLIVLSILWGLIYYNPTEGILYTLGVFLILYAISSLIAFVALWNVVRKRTIKPLMQKMNLSFLILGIASFIWNLLLGISTFVLNDFTIYTNPIADLFSSVESLILVIISVLLILFSKIEVSQSRTIESTN